MTLPDPQLDNPVTRMAVDLARNEIFDVLVENGGLYWAHRMTYLNHSNEQNEKRGTPYAAHVIAYHSYRFDYHKACAILLTGEKP